MTMGRLFIFCYCRSVGHTCEKASLCVSPGRVVWSISLPLAQSDCRRGLLCGFSGEFFPFTRDEAKKVRTSSNFIWLFSLKKNNSLLQNINFVFTHEHVNITSRCKNLRTFQFWIFYFRQKDLDVEVEEQNEELQKLAPDSQQAKTTSPDGKISMSAEDLYCHTERAVYEVKLYQSCQDLHQSHGMNMAAIRTRSVSENGAMLTDKKLTIEVEVKEKRSFLDKMKNTTLFRIFRYDMILIFMIS